MQRESAPRRLNLLARLFKLIGTLTDPEATTSGKAFRYWETNMTAMMDKLAQNDAYLRVVGRMMEQSFFLHAESLRAREALLHAMRLPTSSDLATVERKVARVGNEVEALSTQIEVVLERLEALQNEKSG